MPTITSRQSLPDYAKPTADKIERLGFRWEFDYEYPVPEPDKTQQVQVRDAEHLAPQPEVTKYAAAMKRGDKFPPGVVTRDGRYVDFNTRAKAAHKLGWPHFPVFILNVNYAAATESERERVQLLAASFNTTHGNRLTRAELTYNVRMVAGNPDWTPEQVAKLLGITNGTVGAIFAQFRAEQRARQLGVPLNGAVTDSNKGILGQRSPKFTDRPYREIVRLTQDAGLTSHELRDLCNRVLAAGTEDEQVGVVQAERASREAQIAHFTATGRKRPPLSSELRKRLGFILGHETDVGNLLDLNPETRADYIQQLDQAVAVLRAIADAQRQALAEPVS
jgi:hypothetical protein